jgi:hypothetical protein
VRQVKVQKMRRSVALQCVLVGGLVLAIVAPGAVASEWCGENGVVRVAFDKQGETSAATVEPAPDGSTIVEVYGVLTDVTPLHRDGEAFLALGGFELQLRVTGAEYDVLEQGFAGKILNVGRELGQCVVGFDPSLRLERDGSTYLVRWKLRFAEPVQDVIIDVESVGQTCDTMPECVESEPPALYIGAASANQLSDVFGAGCVAAVLNPSGDARPEPVHAKTSWRDVGLYAERDQ